MKDAQYEVPHQMRKPLIFENRNHEDDLRNVYNPDKLPNPSIWAQKEPVTNSTKPASLEQICPEHPEGLVRAPKDRQYEVPAQLHQPLNWVNAKDEDDLKNSWSYVRHTNAYSQSTPAAANQTKSAMAQGINDDPPFIEARKPELYPQPMIIEKATDDHGFKIPYGGASYRSPNKPNAAVFAPN